jgi:hypothetical protein
MGGGPAGTIRGATDASGVLAAAVDASVAVESDEEDGTGVGLGEALLAAGAALVTGAALTDVLGAGASAADGL